MRQPVSGFSKLTKEQQIDWLAEQHASDPEDFKKRLRSYWHTDDAVQQRHDNFSENTISNFYLPLGVAPNFLIDGKLVTIPMAIEESSVVAAASKAAKFWLNCGGFKTQVKSLHKSGQVHLNFNGPNKELEDFFAFAKAQLIKSLDDINQSMAKRGGGIQSLDLIDKTSQLSGYYQLHAVFDSRDAMGANFINTSLERIAETFKQLAEQGAHFSKARPEVVMSILSNYVPDCLVHVEVSCPIKKIGEVNGIPGEVFVNKFVRAVEIATVEPYRAVTHNKGIMNGIDAVVIATGNDFRAVEAGVHAYAARDGQYRSLSKARVDNGVFTFEAEFPLALGTVGGLTALHPLAALSMDILDNPDAEQLMRVTAACGLAQNFAALHSLVTTGIQQGHMKMHLVNILESLGATADEREVLKTQFKQRTPSMASLREALANLRKN
jgi:hydroxymethylglutaryl-CoA reductase